jgi:hypothetical protein
VRGTRFHLWVGILLYSGLVGNCRDEGDVVGNGAVEDVDEYKIVSGLELL